MKVVLSDRQVSAKCVWCEKDRECVSSTFSDGFIKQQLLCWKCLQTAFKVRSQQSGEAEAKKESVASEGGAK